MVFIKFQNFDENEGGVNDRITIESPNGKNYVEIIYDNQKNRFVIISVGAKKEINGEAIYIDDK